ncbi:MAG: RNA 2',3'-cyclic phosphodiesterase [Candidatus Eremiobacteraeota bacterium]|nr:RNA 2',3'-cyclic phosphodiesterase [Candidatus Eremiobacteraeota bacterium]
MDLDETARTACAAVSEVLQKTGFAARYEGAEKLHVTLAFLGYVEPSRCASIVSKLASSARRADPFGVTLDKLGAFPHERRPRVVYAGARDQGAPFRALAQIVRSAYEGLGFEFRDDAVAHVTLARVKESRRPLPSIEFDPIALEIRELVLFESLPDKAHNTSRYEIIETAPLLRATRASAG